MAADIAPASVTVARITLAPPSFAGRRRRHGGTVNVVAGAEIVGKFLLIGATGDGDRVEPHLRCKLHAEMSEATQAQDGDRIRGPGGGIAQGVEGGDSGAEQGRRIDTLQRIGYSNERLGWGDNIVGIAAVISDSRE